MPAPVKYTLAIWDQKRLGQYQLTYRFAHFNPQQAVVELHGVMPCQGNLRMFNFLSRTFWLARAMIHD